MAINDKDVPLGPDGKPLQSTAQPRNANAQATVPHQGMPKAERVDEPFSKVRSASHSYDISKMKANLEALRMHVTMQRAFSELYPTIHDLLNDGVQIRYVLQQLEIDELPLSEEIFKEWFAACEKLAAR